MGRRSAWRPAAAAGAWVQPAQPPTPPLHKREQQKCYRARAARCVPAGLGPGAARPLLKAARAPRRTGLVLGAAWPPPRLRTMLLSQDSEDAVGALGGKVLTGPQGRASARVPLLGCAWRSCLPSLWGVPWKVGLLSTCPAPGAPSVGVMWAGARGSGPRSPRGRGAVVTPEPRGGRAGADWGCCSVGRGPHLASHMREEALSHPPGGSRPRPGAEAGGVHHSQMVLVRP